MKKMMILAVMMSAMLMPAQMMAKNNNKAKPKVENRINRKEKKEPKVRFDNTRGGKANNKKFYNDKPGRKPMPPVAMRPGKPRPKPMPKPMPRPVPPPRPIYVNDCCGNNVVGATANIIALAALISAIAD